MMNIMHFAPKQEGADGWSSSLIFCQLKEGIKEVVIFHDFFRGEGGVLSATASLNSRQEVDNRCRHIARAGESVSAWQWR